MYYAQEEEWLGEPQQGDFSQGAGVSTSQLQNPNVQIIEHHAPAGPVWVQSPMIFLVIAIILVVVKVLTEKAGEAGEFRTVRIGLENFFIVGLLAALFIYAAKFVSATASWVPTPVKQFFGVV